MGHRNAKSAIDMACWDILGKCADLPVHMLLGGKLTEGSPMYQVIPQKSRGEDLAELAAYRAAGYRQFQVRVGNDWRGDIDRILAAGELTQPDENVYADANRGWTVNEAVHVVRAVRDTGVMIEQPCPAYEECLHVRRFCDLPMKLDEVVTGLETAERTVHDRAAEVVCHKIANPGGLSKARRVRDYLVDHGISVVPEDTWGREITTASVAHFAASTPPEFLYDTTDLHNYVSFSIGGPAPRTAGGKLFAADAPGFGVEPDFSALAGPVATYR